MAKIDEVEILMIDLRPQVKRTDAVQHFVNQETPFVRITDSDGVVGVGYCYTIGTGGPAIISLLKETMAPLLVGQEAEEIGRIWRQLLFSTYSTAVGAITSLSLAAVDIALWDLRCKRAKLPLWRLAGGEKTSLPMYSTEGGWLHLPTESLVEDAVAKKEAGFFGSKIKVGRPTLAEDEARLAAVRDAVGDDFHIMVDANQCFRLPEALRMANMLAEYGVYWFEEPMPADDVVAHGTLARHSRIPIAIGETLYSLAQFNNYLTTGACSIVQADVARVGGITPWLKISALAESFGVPHCPHFLMELHVSLCCALAHTPLLEHIPQLDEITGKKMQVDKGRAHVPMEPGNGIDWDWDEIERLCVPGTRHTFTANGDKR